MKGPDEPVPVSVVIAARDEGHEIAACIASVAWAAEIIVVENDSGDDTVVKARSAGATVFTHTFRSIGGQRNAAIERAAHDWILVLDADERASSSLGNEVRSVAASTAGPGAYRVRRRSFFFGREIRHGGWERDRPVRLFRKHLRFDERPVHEHVITSGPVGTLDAALLHRPYDSLDEYFAKLTRYSQDWACQNHARGRRANGWTLVARPLARFFRMYLLRGGWRDGVHGIVLAGLAAVSVFAKYAHLWAIGRHSSSELPALDR